MSTPLDLNRSSPQENWQHDPQSMNGQNENGTEEEWIDGAMFYDMLDDEDNDDNNDHCIDFDADNYEQEFQQYLQERANYFQVIKNEVLADKQTASSPWICDYVTQSEVFARRRLKAKKSQQFWRQPENVKRKLLFA